MQLCGSLSILWDCLSLGLERKLTFFSCGHCWVSQICWHTECSTFTASSFRIWNSSSGFPSPPLALFLMILPKAHLTSHSRMSGSRWVTTPSSLSGSWRSFLYSSSVYSWVFLNCNGRGLDSTMYNIEEFTFLSRKYKFYKLFLHFQNTRKIKQSLHGPIY